MEGAGVVDARQLTCGERSGKQSDYAQRQAAIAKALQPATNAVATICCTLACTGEREPTSLTLAAPPCFTASFGLLAATPAMKGPPF